MPTAATNSPGRSILNEQSVVSRLSRLWSNPQGFDPVYRKEQKPRQREVRGLTIDVSVNRE
jgi:hypothetical protein